MIVYPPTPRGAVISPCGVYRSALHRRWDLDTFLAEWGAPAVFCMLNPSVADAELDDATIRVCIGYARRWGAGGLVVVNLRGYRATDPDAMIAAEAAGVDIIGPYNAIALGEALILARGARFGLVAAWGVTPVPNLDYSIAQLVAAAAKHGVPITALALTKDGSPRHPLRLKADLLPQAWSP